MKHYLVNEEGEVVRELNEDTRLVEVGSGDRVVRSNSITSYKNKTSTTRKVEFPFVKVNVKWVGDIGYDYPLFCTLLKYLHYEDNMLVFPNGKPINVANLSRDSGKSYITCYRQMMSLIKLDVVKKVKTGNRYIYYLNPYLALCSKRVLITTLDMFKGSKYKEGVRIG